MNKKKESIKQPLHLTPVDSIPPKAKCEHPIHDFVGTFDKFLDMPCAIVRVDTGNSGPDSNYLLYTYISASLRYVKYPIKAIFRTGKVYLVKKDIK